MPRTKLDDIAFFFEPDRTLHVGASAPRNPRKFPASVVKTHGLSQAEQEQHVREVYLPELSEGLQLQGKPHGARACVDLSHFTLHYFEGARR